MLIFPCGPTLQQAQPLVFGREGEVYVKTRRRRGEATLVTGAGVTHPLRIFCSFRTLVEHLRRLNGAGARHLLETELARRRAAGCADALPYVVDHLAPSFCERDWNEAYREDAGPPARPAAAVDLSAEITAVVEAISVPRVPAPSLWLVGRSWVLRASSKARAGMHVRLGGGEILGLTGEYMLASAVEGQWKAAVEGFILSAAARLAEKARPDQDSPALRAARETIAQNGFWKCGDLLFLPGNPPRLGHVLPAHYNRVLGRHSDRDLAVTAPLQMSPSAPSPDIYRRSAVGGWEQFWPPNGLCLGSGPPGGGPATPGLALAAYLRWAALRIAANGRFHASDE